MLWKGYWTGIGVCAYKMKKQVNEWTYRMPLVRQEFWYKFKGGNDMGFLFSKKGSVISDIFMLSEPHANLNALSAYEVTLFKDHLTIETKVGKKSEAALNYSQITDVFYGTETEIKKEQHSIIGRAVLGGLLFGSTGAIVGAMTGGTKETEKIHFYFIISYTASNGEAQFIRFEDTRRYKGEKVASKLKELCGLNHRSDKDDRSFVQL